MLNWIKCKLGILKLEQENVELRRQLQWHRDFVAAKVAELREYESTWKVIKCRVNSSDDDYENIADQLRATLAGGTACCPLCGKSGVHNHTPHEIVIYRNGVKYGRSLS